MSTHNIGFYEDLTKIIFELNVSSNIIKYAPYFFFCFKDAHKKLLISINTIFFIGLSCNSHQICNFICYSAISL